VFTLAEDNFVYFLKIADDGSLRELKNLASRDLHKEWLPLQGLELSDNDSLPELRGWKVIATMRNPNSEKKLTKIPGVTLMALDTTDPQQIQSVGEQVVASGGVDVVFNNAGYGLAGPLEGLSDEQIHRMVNTNMLGPIRTTKALFRISERKKRDCLSTPRP
jgi:short-subunit dehydrogenase involved in D-alanine esterification of teichoic acids